MSSSGSDSSVETDIGEIGDIRPRMSGAERKRIVVLWDDFNNIREIARTTGQSLSEVKETLKSRQKRRIEKELRRS